MSLARAWRRQLFGASGMALLVPGTIACALVVLAFAGGFSKFGSLGQALSGPAAPLGPAAAASTAARASARLTQTLVALGRGGLAAGASTATVNRVGTPAPSGTGVSSGAGSRGTGHGSPGTGTGGGSHGGGSGGGSRPGQRGGHGSSTGTTPTAPTATAPPTLAGGVVSTASSVTSKLPGTVGALATAAVQSLGSTLNRILPAPLGTH